MPELTEIELIVLPFITMLSEVSIQILDDISLFSIILSA